MNQEWKRAIDKEFRRGLFGWHESLLALSAWWKAMAKLGKIPKKIDGD